MPKGIFTLCGSKETAGPGPDEGRAVALPPWGLAVVGALRRSTTFDSFNMNAAPGTNNGWVALVEDSIDGWKK